MSTTLVIEITEELQQQLLERARQQNISLESLVRRSLNNLVGSPIQEESDPILPLLGTLTADINDVGDTHDFYVGQAFLASYQSNLSIVILNGFGKSCRGNPPVLAPGRIPQIIYNRYIF